jgi:small-conductance mechanosensitive channel
MKPGGLLLLMCLLSFPLVQYGQYQPVDIQSADSSIVLRKIPRSIHVVDINFEIERTRKRLIRMNRDLESDPAFEQLDSLIELEKDFIDNEAAEFKQFNPYNLSKYFLENTYRAWSGYKTRLEKWVAFVNKELSNTQDNIDKLGFDKKVWQLTYEKEKSNDNPTQLTKKIREIITEIKDTELKFAALRREMINREDKISEIIFKTDDILEEVSQLQQHQRDNLFVANKPVLWKTVFDKSELFPVLPRLKKAWHENAKTVVNFSKEVNYLYLFLITAIVILLFFLIKRGFSRLGLSKEDPNFVVVQRIFFDHPYATVISLIITLFLLVYTTLPLILTGLLGMLLLVCAWVFLPGMIGKQGEVIVLMVLVLYAANLTEIVVWYFGNYARFYITTESLLALFLTYKFGLHGFKRIAKNAAPFLKEIWWLFLLLFVLFSVALLANLFGYMNLAVLMLKIGVKIAGIVVIIFGAHAILRAMVFASIEIGRHTNVRVMKNRWDVLEKRLIQLVNILAVLFLLKFILQNVGMYRPTMDWLLEFLGHDWEIGTLNISIGGIFSLILILAISFGFANFFKIIIEDEFLVHTNLPKGVPAAISVTIRYFIIVLGLTMALSAAGIDLGSFGLLAGALGVGIGFGLQNIVNNFISGLILVYERPVNVGDTVEVENLIGVVHRVGVRSSNVRTFDGAEVVVPNGNLISNQLINWTLSDNQRRVELKVGAAYGSDPNLVLELLKKVALEHEDVLKDPEPRALFDGFGDSSLDFRLLFWVSFEMGIGTKSDIAIGIYNIFAENNIQIPFPQIDLHVKKEDEESVSKSEPKKEISKKSTSAKENSSKSGPVEEAELKPPE